MDEDVKIMGMRFAQIKFKLLHADTILNYHISIPNFNLDTFSVKISLIPLLVILHWLKTRQTPKQPNFINFAS